MRDYGDHGNTSFGSLRGLASVNMAGRVSPDFHEHHGRILPRLIPGNHYNQPVPTPDGFFSNE